MDERHGRAAVEFGVERFETPISDVTVVDACQQRDAVEPEIVQRPRGFGERGVDIRQGQKSEASEGAYRAAIELLPDEQRFRREMERVLAAR